MEDPYFTPTMYRVFTRHDFRLELELWVVGLDYNMVHELIWGLGSAKRDRRAKSVCEERPGPICCVRRTPLSQQPIDREWGGMGRAVSTLRKLLSGDCLGELPYITIEGSWKPAHGPASKPHGSSYLDPLGCLPAFFVPMWYLR